MSHPRRSFAPLSLALPPLLLALASARPVQADVPTVVDLRVENQVGHLNVVPAAPRLSWRLVDPARGTRQSAYRVLVASSEDVLDQDVGDVWDSGQVASAAQHLVPYAGSALIGAERYWWKVRIWDEDGAPSEWSPTSTFDTTPSGTDWVADFLWDATTNDNDTVYLRKAFELPAAVELGKLFVTAHDEFAVWVNGTLVGRGPAPADPCDSQRVVAYDVTPHLVAGENVLAARAHWDGGMGHSGVLGEGVFALQAELHLPGDTRLRIATDSTWRVLADTPYDESAPLRGPSFAMASAVEEYDARLEPVDWRLSGFDDSGWEPPTVRVVPFRLASQQVPSSTELETYPAVSVTEVEPELWLVDFGRNTTGWIRLDVPETDPGQRIVVHYSEEVVDGRIVRDRDRITDMWDAYTSDGTSATWEPDIDVMGFRYLEVEGYPGPLDPAAVRMVRFGTPLERATTFQSSSAVLEDLLRISRETIEACAQGVLVDCPTREQTQFMMDAYVQAYVLSRNYRESNLLAKTLRDLRESDVGLGVLSGRHPSQGFVLLAEWMLSWMLAIDLGWQTTGDERIVTDNLATLETLLDRFATYVDDDTGIILTLPAGTYPFLGVDKTEPGLVTLNSLYVGALRAAARVAGAVNEVALATQWSAQADAVAAGIHAELYDGAGGYLNAVDSVGQVQLGSALPLLYDVTPAADRDAVVARYAQWGFEAETLGGFFLSRAFVELDLGDQLVDAFEDPTRHWGAILAAGGTSTWESWDSTYSLAHAWSAYPLSAVVEGTAGISPAAPGWAEIRYRPLLAESLDFAEASVMTPYGEASLAWEEQAFAIRAVNVTVPPNTTGHVSIPVRGYLRWAVFEGPEPIYKNGLFNDNVEGIALDGVERQFLRLTLEPGMYSFQVRGITYGGSRLGTAPGASTRR